MKVNVDFCEKRAKKEWGLTMASVVEASERKGGLGLHRTWWSKLKRGEFNLTEERAKQIAKALKCDVSDVCIKEEKETGYKVTGSVVTIDETLYNWLTSISKTIDANNKILNRLLSKEDEK